MSRSGYRLALFLICMVLVGATYHRLSFVLDAQISYPFGPDPAIWGKAALLAKHNAPQTVPPAYPELVSLLSQKDGLVQGALRANLLSVFLGAWGCLLGVHWLIKEKKSALLLGSASALLVLYAYPLFPYMYYIQPDIMALGMISMCAASLLGVYRFRSRSAILFCGFWIGLTFSTREHGLVLLLASSFLLWWIVRYSSQMLLFGLGVQFGGGLGAGAPYLPFFRPHGGLNGSLTKAQVTLMDVLARRTSNNMAGQTIYEQEGKNAQGIWEYIQNLLGQSFVKSSDFHTELAILLVGCLCVSLLYRKRMWIVVLIAISPLLASLIVWTQWRHFFVVLPVMTIFGLGGLGVLSRRFFAGYGVLAVVGYCLFYTAVLEPFQEYYAKHTKEELLSRQSNFSVQIDMARELRALDDGKSLIMAEPIVSILTGMAPIQLQGDEIQTKIPPSYPNFVYWTYVVSEIPMRIPWQLLQRQGHYYVYKMAYPEGISVDCLKGDWDGPIVENLPQHGKRLLPYVPEGCPFTNGAQ